MAVTPGDAFSGEQVELAAGTARLVIAQVGASLRRLTVDGDDVPGIGPAGNGADGATDGSES